MLKEGGGKRATAWGRAPLIPIPLGWSQLSDGFENLKPSARPRAPLFPGGLVFFCRWRTLRWFILLAVPAIAGSTMVLVGGHAIASLISLVVGLTSSSVMFVVACSGMTSSNWGTYFRRREPVRYWISFAIAVAAYCTIVGGSFYFSFGPQPNPGVERSCDD